LVWDNTQLEPWIEGDLKMCDQSQDFGALQYCSWALRQLGVPFLVAEIIRRLTSNKYVLKSNTVLQVIFIMRVQRAMRDTGNCDTSLGNSIFTASGWVSERLGIHTFLELGMDVKIHSAKTIYEVTFLKGMWYPTEQGPYWGMLPSRILKVGKSWRDPRDLYKGRSYEQASAQFLNDLADGYRGFLSVPLMRRFVSQFARTPRQRDVLEMDWVNVSSASVTKPCVLVEQAWYWLHVRYGLEDVDFMEMEAMIPSKPFVFMSHPGFNRLGAVDYS